MKRRYTLALCLGMLCSIAAASEARAQYGMGCGNYGAFDVGRLYGVMANNVPYFAAFPPVYYSRPVARTYGYSPFAYPPGTMTPEIVEAAPLEIKNPHVRASTVAPETNEDKTTLLKSRTAPLAILNPFVVGQGAQNRLTSLPVSQLER